MTKLTANQVRVGISVLYLAGLTVVAGLALRWAIYYSLPIPSILSALTIALPPLAGIGLESGRQYRARQTARGRQETSRTLHVITAVLLVYETVLATLAGTRLAPVQNLWCPLREKWTDLFRHKNAADLRKIQDALNCCGFNTPRDMAFPFPDKFHGSDTCMVRYERGVSCGEPWAAMERKVAVMLLLVPIGVFLWKLSVFATPAFSFPWLPSAIRLPRDNDAGAESARPRPAIRFRDVEEREEIDSLEEEVARLNQDSNLAAQVESGRVRPSPLIQEPVSNMWARE